MKSRKLDENKYRKTEMREKNKERDRTLGNEIQNKNKAKRELQKEQETKEGRQDK